MKYFFVKCYGDPRDLHVLPHSYPTRRSSGLLFVGSAFQPKLEGSYRPRAERRLQQVRKIAADGGWRNEVKLAGRARLALEPAGEVGIEAEAIGRAHV